MATSNERGGALAGFMRAVLLGVVAVIFLVAVVGSAAKPGATGTTTPTDAVQGGAVIPAPTTADVPTTAALAPRASDFIVTLNVVDDTCFDTAGASITVQPALTYNGPAIKGDWTLTYSVIGGTSSDIHSIDITGAGFRAEQQQVDTPTCSGTPTAAPVSVLPAQ